MGPPDGAQTLAFNVAAHSREVAGIRRAVCTLGRGAGFDADRLADVALAVAEACANAIVHAYAGCEPGVLRVTANVGPDGLQVVVADEGHGMTPRPDSPGLGLGLPLMASLTTALEVRLRPAGGTEIWMTFASPGPAVAGTWAQAG
jgi:serine/threonine-protein kinase RsbW/stage II sporulation protein AB (anti-sigma F factor)